MHVITRVLCELTHKGREALTEQFSDSEDTIDLSTLEQALDSIKEPQPGDSKEMIEKMHENRSILEILFIPIHNC